MEQDEHLNISETITAIVSKPNSLDYFEIKFTPTKDIPNFEILKTRIIQATEKWLLKTRNGKIVANGLRSTGKSFTIADVAGHMFDWQLLDCLRSAGIVDLQITGSYADDIEKLQFWTSDDSLVNLNHNSN